MGNLFVSPTEPDQDGIAVRLHGEVDTAVAAELRRILIDMIMRRRPARIVIDLRAVTALDAAVLAPRALPGTWPTMLTFPWPSRAPAHRSPPCWSTSTSS